MRTVEELRAFAKTQLPRLAETMRANEQVYLAKAAKCSRHAAYVEHRAKSVDQMDEVTLRLMVADWAAHHQVVAHGEGEAMAARAEMQGLQDWLFPGEEQK